MEIIKFLIASKFSSLQSASLIQIMPKKLFFTLTLIFQNHQYANFQGQFSQTYAKKLGKMSYTLELNQVH